MRGSILGFLLREMWVIKIYGSQVCLRFAKLLRLVVVNRGSVVGFGCKHLALID